MISEIYRSIEKVGSLETDMKGLRTEVNGVGINRNSVKKNVTSLKTNVTGLRTNITGLRTDMDKILEWIPFTANFNIIKKLYSRINRKVYQFEDKQEG